VPVRKFRSLEEATEALWEDPRNPDYLRRLGWLWRFAQQLAPRRYPRGVHRYRSIGDANRSREEWEHPGSSPER